MSSRKRRKLHNEEIHSLYSESNTARVIKSVRLRWGGHLARMEEGRGDFKMLTEKPFRKALGVDRRTMMELILFKYVPI